MEDVIQLFDIEKKRINTHIREIFSAYRTNVKQVHATAEATLTKLEKFTLGGKGVRGTLLTTSACMYGYLNEKTALDIAASLEILHSSLLIHDDIMDNDLLRRGNPSIYAQYRQPGDDLKNNGSLDFAKSMGICVGDIGFFLGLDICNRSLSQEKYSSEIFCTLCKEFVIVALAQMNDVYFSYDNRMPSVEEIMKVYTYKTARYTFSLPLCLGAQLAGKDEETRKNLDKLGEHMGIIFQIRDDEIGLFSTEQQIGKPVGSDLRENKKTLIRALLNEYVPEKHRKELDKIFLKHSASPEDQTLIKRYMHDYQVSEKLKQMMHQHQSDALHIIDALNIENTYKTFFHNLVDYVATRNS